MCIILYYNTCTISMLVFVLSYGSLGCVSCYCRHGNINSLEITNDALQVARNLVVIATSLSFAYSTDLIIHAAHKTSASKIKYINIFFVRPLAGVCSYSCPITCQDSARLRNLVGSKDLLGCSICKH